MKRKIAIITLICTLLGCQNKKTDKAKCLDVNCTDNCKAKNKSADISCKLTTPELQQRKTTVLESLRKQALEKKELTNGYAFKFKGTDNMLDELTEFIKTERVCCDFFTFNLSISGDKSEIWLEITGADGAKDFIKTELEL